MPASWVVLRNGPHGVQPVPITGRCRRVKRFPRRPRGDAEPSAHVWCAQPTLRYAPIRDAIASGGGTARDESCYATPTSAHLVRYVA